MWYNLVQVNAQDLVNLDVFSGGGAIYNAFSLTPSFTLSKSLHAFCMLKS